MCDICDGQTIEQVRRKRELTLITYGWVLPSVHPGADEDPSGPHWTYTLGLLENFDHPELVLTETEPELAGKMLNGLGEMVRAGEDISDMTEFGFSFRDVHEAHFSTGLLNAWIDHYGRLPEPGQVTQVVPPDTYYCTCHAHLRTDLSDPEESVGSRRPNRSQRRTMERDRRRSASSTQHRNDPGR